MPQVAQLVSRRARVSVGQPDSRPHALGHDTIYSSAFLVFLPSQPELHIDWDTELIDRTSLHPLPLEAVFAVTYTVKSEFLSTMHMPHSLVLLILIICCTVLKLHVTAQMYETLSLHMLFSLLRRLFFSTCLVKPCHPTQAVSAQLKYYFFGTAFLNIPCRVNQSLTAPQKG